MTYILLALIAFSFAWQPNDERRFAAIVFGFFYVVHALLRPYLGAEQYFFSGAVFDLAIIYILGCMRPQEMIHILQVLCVYSITTNYLGWQLWDMYMPPTIYENTFVAIYAASLLTLIVGGPDGWRTFKDRCTASWLLGDIGRGHSKGTAIREEARW